MARTAKNNQLSKKDTNIYANFMNEEKKMKNKNLKLELVQQKNLVNVFDLSVDYFKDRIGTCFFEGIHFFPQSKSKTKKMVLWDIPEVKKTLKSPSKKILHDEEVAELLKRR